MVEPGALVEHSLDASGHNTNTWLEEVKFNDQLYFARKWLSGDLFRSLSFEGKSLSEQFIRNEMNKTIDQLSLLRQLSSRIV